MHTSLQSQTKDWHERSLVDILNLPVQSRTRQLVFPIDSYGIEIIISKYKYLQSSKTPNCIDQNLQDGLQKIACPTLNEALVESSSIKNDFQLSVDLNLKILSEELWGKSYLYYIATTPLGVIW